MVAEHECERAHCEFELRVPQFSLDIVAGQALLAGATSKGDGGFGDHAISTDSTRRRDHGWRGCGDRND